MKSVKPLLIEMPFESDIGNVIQVARAEGKKVFKCEKVQIYDVIRWYPHGWIVMCQNGDGCSNGQGVGLKKLSS